MLRWRGSTRCSAEVRRGGVLAGLDDAAADGAGAGEVGVERVAVAHADGTLQDEELLGEAAEDVERRLLVGEEHVAPHRRVGGGDAGEVAEAGGRVVDDFLLGDPGEVLGDADHGVGDEVRDVARHREHEVVVVGVHRVDAGAELGPEGLEVGEGLRRGVGRGA